MDANASNNSVVDMQSLKWHLNNSYAQLEERLDDLETQKATPANIDIFLPHLKIF